MEREPDERSAYTVEEVATRLGVSVRSVWRRIRAGELVAVHATGSGSAGRGRTFVTGESLARLTAGTTPNVMEPDGTPQQLSHARHSGTLPPGQVVERLAASVADLSAAVTSLTAQLAAAELERRQLVHEVAALRAIPQIAGPADQAPDLPSGVTEKGDDRPAGLELPDASSVSATVEQAAKQAGLGKKQRRRLLEKVAAALRLRL